MNIGTIAAMIQADPTIVDDVPAFRARMNLRNQTQVVKQTTTTIDVTRQVSIADLQGGPCTSADVQAAVNLLSAAPLRVKVQIVIDEVQQKVDSGQVTNLATLKSAFQTAINNLS